MLKLLPLYVICVNLVTYWIYRLDKRRAEKGGRRFSERELLAWALVGGSPAAIFAVRTLPHKTRKTKFKLGLAAVLLVQLGSGLLFLL